MAADEDKPAPQAGNTGAVARIAAPRQWIDLSSMARAGNGAAGCLSTASSSPFRTPAGTVS
jgi:hypothetical protein